MKTWAEVETSPEFLNAHEKTKDEVREFYKSHIQSQDRFRDLPPDEQEAVLKRIDGDGNSPLQAAALLIVSAKNESLGRAVVNPQEKDALEDALKGAKAAEHYLDVPLKDRPREPFQDALPGHLDKPLRALLGFIDDALPEYSAYKFWMSHAGQPLEERLRNVLAASATQPERPVDANAALNIAGFIRTYADLDRRLPTRLPPLRQWSSAAQEQQLTTDAEAALKHGLTQAQWLAPDRAVQTVLVHVLAGVKGGIPRAFRPDAVTAVVASVKQRAYEMLARAFYRLPSPAGRIALDPEAIGEIIFAADALAPGMTQVADDFPALFSVAAGLAAVPPNAVGRYRTFIQAEVGTPMTPEILLRIVTTGGFSFIKLSEVDEVIFREGAAAAGARGAQLPHLVRDAVTAAQKPLLSALLERSALLDTQDFKKARDEVRKRLDEEVQKRMRSKAPEPPPPDFSDDVYQNAMATMFPDHRVDIIHFPRPEDPDATQEPVQTPTTQESEAPQSPTETPQSDPTEVPKAPRDNPVRAYLTDHPISIKSVKKVGLMSEFKAYPDVLSKDGENIDVSLEALVAAVALPPKSDYNDLLDALETRGQDTPPPTKEAKTDGSAGPSASSSENALKVRVVEVDPASLIPTKTPSEIEPGRLRGVQQRFPEGKGYPAVTTWEDHKGLHLIDGHHRMLVAKERGDEIKAAVISKKDYDALVSKGVDHTEISYAILAQAGQADAMKHLREQYPAKTLSPSPSTPGRLAPAS